MQIIVLKKEKKLVKVAKTTMIDWICKIWQNEKKITQEMIYKSFRCTVIANNLSRSENYFFTVWKKHARRSSINRR